VNNQDVVLNNTTNSTNHARAL